MAEILPLKKSGGTGVRLAQSPKRDSPEPVQTPPPKYDGNNAEAKEIYENTIQFSRKLIREFSQNPKRLLDKEGLYQSVDTILEFIQRAPTPLLDLTQRSTLEDYLVAHMANVTILSLNLCHPMGWDIETKRSVGFAAWLHDADILLQRSGPMTVSALVMLQPLLSSLPSSTQEIIRETIQPDSDLNNPRFSQESQLVHLCDIYESLTHPRLGRKRKLPSDALKELSLNSKNVFDPQLVRALEETLTPYPPGSYVRICNGEIGKVVALNRQAPTRPVLQIQFTERGERNRTEKILDLSNSEGLFVTQPINECSLDLADKKYLLLLKLKKWWLKE
ncbi:MAG: hypothetical protein HY610_03825 [Elusimicrobia bacterium]|nr:hypothetical protein [Elusimicrobiota bacterium]